MPRMITMLLAAVLLLGCESKKTHLRAIKSPHVEAANFLTKRYTEPHFSGWNLRATAAGRNCDVLFLRTEMILEDSMVEAIHYGTGAYDIYEGGVQRYYRERLFRGVAYEDRTGRIWTYGAVSPAEAGALMPCH